MTYCSGCVGGHYVTYALNAMSRSWYKFNDAIVVPVTEQTVSSCEAYILFYRYCALGFFFLFLLSTSNISMKTNVFTCMSVKVTPLVLRFQYKCLKCCRHDGKSLALEMKPSKHISYEICLEHFIASVCFDAIG